LHPSASSRAPEIGLLAERRQLTVVFCDLAGSTALSARVDPDDFREILEQYRRAVAATAQHYGGFAARHLGDGALIYFGYPYAQEFDAERAIQASISLIHAISELKAKEPISARIGVASGLVVVGELSDAQGSENHEVLGETPNLAARLQSLAQPGQVIVAERTRRLGTTRCARSFSCVLLMHCRWRAAMNTQSKSS
jgi:class 3 adenylate cyclase